MAEGIKTAITYREDNPIKEDTPEFDTLSDYTESVCDMCIIANEKWGEFLSPEEEKRINARFGMMLKLGHIRDTEVVTIRALLNLEICSIVRYFTKEVLQDQIGSTVRDIVIRMKEHQVYSNHKEVLNMVINGYGNNNCYLEKVVRNRLFIAIYQMDIPVIRDYLEKSRRSFMPRLYMTEEF